MYRNNKMALKQQLLTKIGSVLALLLCTLNIYAQEKPPRPIIIYVNPAQGLSFGAFARVVQEELSSFPQMAPDQLPEV